MSTTQFMQLSGDHTTPIYQQIKDAIRAKISSGEWRAGDQIPSENQLASMLQLSRMTVNRPLRELANEGVLNRVHGLGTFVAEQPRRAHLIELVSIADEIKAANRSYRAKILSTDTVHCNAAQAKALHLKLDARAFRVRVVHYQDGEPIQFEDRLVNPLVVPDFINSDFSQLPPTDYLIQHLVPDDIEHIVRAVLPAPYIAQHLAIQATEPCLVLKRRTFIGEDVVTAVELTYPSSRYELGARFTANSNTGKE